MELRFEDPVPGEANVLPLATSELEPFIFIAREFREAAVELPPLDAPLIGAVIPTMLEWSITLRKLGGTGPPGIYAGDRPILPTKTDGRIPLTGVVGGVGGLYPAGPFTTGAVGCQLVMVPPCWNELPGTQNQPTPVEYAHDP